MNDLRFAFRQLLKNPGFTAVAALTLAMGIGANTAVFSLVNALLFRPLPFREPGRLVWLANTVRGGAGIPDMTGRANFLDWRELNHSFEDLGGYLPSFTRINYTLTGNGEPTRAEGAVVTGNFLQVLGVQPRLGRNFIDEECQRNGPKAVILTDRFWKQRFQADASIVGRSITINNQSWTVVGILPASFDFSSVFTPGSKVVEFLRPFLNIPGYDKWGNLIAVIGRLKPGITVPKAQSEFDVLNKQLQSAHPDRGSFDARLASLRKHTSGQFRRPFLVLLCAVGCVLLIACANLSNLLLARAAARRKEIAVRVALGAARARLLRQMLTESVLLACCGAALGLPLAYLATNALARSSAFSIPLLQTARVDGMALGFTLLIAFATGLLFGIVPAVQLSHADVHRDLKEANRSSSHGRRQVWMREALVASEVALACVLLVGAGLLIRSFVRLIDVDLGFRTEQTAAWRIQPNREFATNSQEMVFYKELLRNIEALPGVESVSFTDKLPLDLNDVVNVRAKGEVYLPSETSSAFARFVDPGYFKTMRIPLRAGRDFDSHDVPFDWHDPVATEKAAIINEKLAQRFWPGKNAVGQMVFIDDAFALTVECKVVGVVGNVRQSALEQEAGPEIYVLGRWGPDLIVRAKGTLASIVPFVRATLRKIDPNMAVDEFRPLSQILDQAVSPKRLVVLLLSVFSFLALLLAAVGIYGVIAYSVTQRTQEIGIRLALGSPKSAMLRLIILEGMRVVCIGCAIGLIASFALTRVIQALLFRVDATDPLTFVASGLVLLAVALLACWIPARRAARVDPMEALKYE